MRRWLPTWWYPVDHAERVIYESPRRRRIQIYDFGCVPLIEFSCKQMRPAILGWPERPLPQAAILAALRDHQRVGGMCHSDLRSAAERLYRRHGWVPPSAGWCTALQSLWLDGLVCCTPRGRYRGRYALGQGVTPSITPCPVAPVLGAALTDQVFANYERAVTLRIHSYKGAA